MSHITIREAHLISMAAKGAPLRVAAKRCGIPLDEAQRIIRRHGGPDPITLAPLATELEHRLQAPTSRAKTEPTRRPWTPAEDELLYASPLTDAQLGQTIGRTNDAIRSRRKWLSRHQSRALHAA